MLEVSLACLSVSQLVGQSIISELVCQSESVDSQLVGLSVHCCCSIQQPQSTWNVFGIVDIQTGVANAL